MNESVNILPCCGGHEEHLDSCPHMWTPEELEDHYLQALTEEENRWG